MELDELLKMDIFFVVTTVAVAVVGIIVAFALFYIAKLLRDLSEIAKIARREAEEIAQDIDAVRADIREGVSDAREAVAYGLKTARGASGAMAGAGIVRTLAQVFDSFREEKRPRRKASRRKESE